MPASDQSRSLHREVQARFLSAFGDPHHVMAADVHWRLVPRTRPYSINVLLNGDRERPALWIFDPYDADDGVVKTSIASTGEADAMIEQIQRRLASAAENRHSRS